MSTFSAANLNVNANRIPSPNMYISVIVSFDVTYKYLRSKISSEPSRAFLNHAYLLHFTLYDYMLEFKCCRKSKYGMCKGVISILLSLLAKRVR